MAKSLSLLFTIVLLTTIFIQCEKRPETSSSKDSGEVKLSLVKVDEFSYVVMRQPGSAGDPGQSIQNFIEEAKNQHVIATGPLFVIFYQLPESVLVFLKMQIR